MKKKPKTEHVLCGTCFAAFSGPDAAELLKNHYTDKHPKKTEKQ